MNLCVRQATVAKNNMAEVELNSINIKKIIIIDLKTLLFKIVYQLNFFILLLHMPLLRARLRRNQLRLIGRPFSIFFAKKTQFRLGFEVWC